MQMKRSSSPSLPREAAAPAKVYTVRKLQGHTEGPYDGVLVAVKSLDNNCEIYLFWCIKFSVHTDFNRILEV